MKGQSKSRLDALNGLDKFVLGDDIAKYANTITENVSKDTTKTLHSYRYSGKDVKMFLGFEINNITLEFCSGKLESVRYHFDITAPRSQKTFTRAQMDQLKNKLIQQFGNTRMHNNNSMNPDEKGRGGMNSESWTWVNQNAMMSLMWMKTSFSNKDFVSVSVLDRELRKKCSGK